MATATCMPMILLFRQRPTIFPSPSAHEDALNRKKFSLLDMWKDIVTLAKNKNFRIVFFIFAIMNGSVICLGAIINFLLEGFGFNNVEVTIMSVTFIGVGLITSMIFPILIEKLHWFKISLRIIAGGACLATLFCLVTAKMENFLLSIVSIGIMGGFLIPTLCVIYSFAIELTYPVSVALFGCLLQAGASIYGTLMTYLTTWIIS
jgi:hypothetical protein